MKFMVLMSIMTSTIFMKSSHPVSLMAIILFQTMIMCLLVWLMSSLSWFSYILFLIFLGGLMVLFVYISSLASNEMFYMNIKSNINSITLIGVIFIISLLGHSQQLFTHLLNPVNKSFSAVYSTVMAMPTMTTMIYLLLTLVVVVKMTSKYEGPLRNMIFNK